MPRAHDDAITLRDDERIAEAAWYTGYVSLHGGQMDTARVALDECFTRAKGVSDFLVSVALTLRGMLLFAIGELDAGVALIEEARQIQIRLDDYEVGGVALSFLAQMTFAKGDHARALELYQRA